MSSSKSVIIMGYSGHAYVAIETAKRMGLKVIAYLDKKEANQNPFQLQFLGSENDLNRNISNELVFPAIGDNKIRRRLVETIRENKWYETKLIDPSAIISESSIVNFSTIIMPRVTINSFANVGYGCIINTGAIIEHECSIGNYTHIAPGAVITGSVKIGESCFIGAGAAIKNGTSIGNNVIVGAGAVVIHDLPSNSTWVGNPAKPIKI